MNLPIVSYTLIYNSKDISRDISDQVLNIQYTDKQTGESDEIEISLEDSEKRWQNGWFPTKGDTIELNIQQNSRQLKCGLFEVDEISCSGSTSGDIFAIKGLAAGVKKKLRTKSTYAHEDKSLREIANTVAANLGLTLMGTIPAITFHRSHQYRETDLGFLNRVGSDYGCVFSVRGINLIFTYYKDLEGRASSLSLARQDIISWEIHDTTHKTFKQARVKHHDPISKEVQEYVATYDDSDDEEQSADHLEIRTKAENKQQAAAKAEHALYKNNTAGVGGDITLPGNVLFVSGNNVQLNGLGKFSGIFHIMESTHTISQSGSYETSGNVKRVKTIDPSNFKT